MSANAAKIIEHKELIEQLKVEVKLDRLKMSVVIKDLIKYCEDNQKNDPLVSGFKSMKDNPFQEKSGCQII